MSRSGTTLLSCVLDAHPSIAAGAELIPTDIPDLTQLRDVVEKALEESADFSETGRYIRRNIDKAMGSNVVRCYRAGATASDLLETIDQFLDSGLRSVTSFEDRFSFAVAIIERRRQREGKRFGSFKLNTPTLLPVLETYPAAFVVCLVRHPADVVHSHIKNNFGKPAAQICKAWLRYLRSFESACDQFGDRVAVIKYEDFVAEPEEVLASIFDLLPIDMDARMLNYQEADSRILNSRHPNTDTLRRGIVTDAVGVSTRQNDTTISTAVTRNCRAQMRAWGYMS